MYRISIPALIIAFFAELAADWVIQVGMLFMLGSGTLSTDMPEADFQAAVLVISQTPAFIVAIFILGSATTIGGGYLAARIARKFPYYHGLAMGIVGIAYVLYFWRANDLWLNLVAVLSNIPLSIYGAHLAKRSLPPEV